MSNLGEWTLPDELKNDIEFLYWLNQRSYRFHSKKILNKLKYGELENNYTVKGYKTLLRMAGTPKKEADLAGARLYLDRKNAR